MTQISTSSLVLITGATGHVGFCTLIHALGAGYSVRAAVRSQAKANILLSHPHIRYLNPGSRFTFIIVPDLSAPRAYEEAVRGVGYIIHIASPLMTGRKVPISGYEAFFIEPAVRGTLGILEAANQCRTVRRVVITSSITALVPIAQLTGEEASIRCILPTDRIPFVSGPYKSELAAYAASKVAALEAAEVWVQTRKPTFDVVYLHPSYVVGRNDLAMSPREALKGTNAIVLGIALGKTFNSTAGATLHNEDVARAHVQALDAAVPGNTSYILSHGTQWDDVQDIVRREFSDAVAKRVLPNCGSAATHTIVFDTSLTEKTFVLPHLGFEEQVKSVVSHYLELRARQRIAARTTEPAKGSVRLCQQGRANA